MSINTNSLALGMVVGKTRGLSQQDTLKLSMFGSILGGENHNNAMMTMLLLPKTMFDRSKPQGMLTADRQKEPDAKEASEKVPVPIGEDTIKEMAKSIENLNRNQREMMAMITNPVAAKGQQSRSAPEVEKKPKP